MKDARVKYVKKEKNVISFIFIIHFFIYEMLTYKLKVFGKIYTLIYILN